MAVEVAGVALGVVVAVAGVGLGVATAGMSDAAQPTVSTARNKPGAQLTRIISARVVDGRL
jgi:hypothetical protein